jgi:hypothetical protein
MSQELTPGERVMVEAFGIHPEDAHTGRHRRDREASWPAYALLPLLPVWAVWWLICKALNWKDNR